MPTNLLPVIAPRMEPSCTHSATSPKSQLSTVPLPDNCVVIPIFQDGSSSMPFHHTHIQAHSGKLGLQVSGESTHSFVEGELSFLVGLSGGVLKASIAALGQMCFGL